MANTTIDATDRLAVYRETLRALVSAEALRDAWVMFEAIEDVLAGREPGAHSAA